jgi:glycosyltransferase involved in cell wall biosynthesis
MRIGYKTLQIQSPLQPARVTAAVVTFIPKETGYYQDRLAAIKLSLASLVKNANAPIDLMVLDNGSCPALVEHLCLLKDQGVIQYLILNSTNIGLAGAYQIISGAAPGEIIAFANDDVFYFPNWLSPQVEIIDNFPDVGLVSGAYLRATKPGIAQLALGKGLDVINVPAPDEWIYEFCRDASYSSPEAYYKAQERMGRTDLEDRLIVSKGVSAYAGGVCWQAVFHKQTMRELLPRDDPKKHGIPSYDGYFHAEIVRRGYLRLSTPQRLTRHIGNVVTPEFAELASQFGIDIQATWSGANVQLAKHFLLRLALSRVAVTKLYNYLYRVMNS